MTKNKDGSITLTIEGRFKMLGFSSAIFDNKNEIPRKKQVKDGDLEDVLLHIKRKEFNVCLIKDEKEQD